MNKRTLPYLFLAQMCVAGLGAKEAEGTLDEALSFENETDAYVLETVQPKYPMEMLQRGKEGHALVKLRVGKDGEVENLRVVSSTNDLFERAAIKSLSKWYFQPGTRDGEPVSQTVVVPVNFLIEDAQSQALATL